MLRKLISLLCVAAMLCAVIPCAFAEGIILSERTNQDVVVEAGETAKTTTDATIKSLDNSGTVSAKGAGVTVTGSVTNSEDGQIVIEKNGSKNGNIAAGSIDNSGSIDVQRGVYISGEQVNNDGKIDAAFITDKENWANGASNTGELVVNNNGGAEITVGSIAADRIVNNGTFTVENHKGIDSATVKVREIENTNEFKAGNITGEHGEGKVEEIANFGHLKADGAVDVENLYNYGTIEAGELNVNAENVTNNGTITVGQGQHAQTYYGVRSGNMEYVKLESEGLGVKSGEVFDKELTAEKPAGSWKFKGWQVFTTQDGEFWFSQGTVKSTKIEINAVTLFDALWEKISNHSSNIIKWVDSEVEMVKDADGKKLEQGVEYTHVALNKAKEYVVLFSTDMLKAMGKGVHEFTIVLKDGTEIPYRIDLG